MDLYPLVKVIHERNVREAMAELGYREMQRNVIQRDEDERDVTGRNMTQRKAPPKRRLWIRELQSIFAYAISTWQAAYAPVRQREHHPNLPIQSERNVVK